MKLTSKGEYACRAVLALTLRHREGIVPMQDVARDEKIPGKYLEQILLSLKKAGILKSKRGVKGGYYLARSPSQITLAEVLRVMEGDLFPDLMARGGEDDPYPALTRVWKEVKGTVTEILAKVNFQELCDRSREERLRKARSYIYHI